MEAEHDYSSLLVDGKYKVQTLVGVGSMSYVYRGLDNLGRTVAIKIMKPTLVSDEEIVTRFVREIRTCMSLTHKNIVTVYHGGKLESGEPYLVMEFLRGHNLLEIFKEKKTLPMAQALEIIAQAADALELAHSRGYIHRDIKPQNLMVIKNKGIEALFRPDLVKVLDFGVAKMFGSWHNLDKFATAPGNVLGTPLYMSPEQVLGNKLDGRSDIYALGCVLYQALCGAPAIVGNSAMDVMRAHLDYKPLHIKTHVPAYTDELNSIVQKSMAKHPQERYESMAELAETLRQYYMSPMVYKLWNFYEEMSGKGKVSPVLKSMSRKKNK